MSTEEQSGPPRIRTRQLGKTGVDVSELALGTWGLAANAYGKVEPSRYEAVVRRAWELGITTFDVAPLWGESAALWRTAAALGDHLEGAVIISRVGRVRMEGHLMGRFESQAILEECDEQLSRLGRDHIDVLLLHNPPAKVLMAPETFVKGLVSLQESGKIRAWGVSVGDTETARLSLKIGAKVVCMAHNLLWPDDLRDLEVGLEANEAGVVVRSPLAHGLLSGRFAAEHEFDPEDHRARRWDAGSLAERVRQVEELRFLVDDDVYDLPSAALRFALLNQHVGCIAVGARDVDQLEHATQALPAEPPYLREEQLARLAKVHAAR